MESGHRCVNRFGVDRSEQSPGSLRIEKQILIFERHAVSESYAIADERAIIFQTAGKMSVARSFERAGKIFKRAVIDFERDSIDAARRITE